MPSTLLTITIFEMRTVCISDDNDICVYVDANFFSLLSEEDFGL